MRRRSGHGLPPDEKEGWSWRGRIKKEKLKRNLVKQTYLLFSLIFVLQLEADGQGKEEIVEDIYMCLCGGGGEG